MTRPWLRTCWVNSDWMKRAPASGSQSAPGVTENYIDHQNIITKNSDYYECPDLIHCLGEK